MSQAVSGRWHKPTITGELVLLRPVGFGDADAVWEMVHDPEGRDLTATTATFTREQVEAWCAGRAAAEGRLDLAVVERATGEYAGEVVLNEPDEETGSANVRVALRGPRFHGRGLGGEATRLLVDHALRTMGLRRLTLTVLARNPRALRAYARAGFREVGRHAEDGEDWVEMELHASHLAPDYPVLTERLRLRPVDRHRDVPALHAYRSREDVVRYTPLVPGTVEQLAERLADPERSRTTIDAAGQALTLVVERQDTGEVVGDVVLFWHDVASGHAEIGYVLHPDHTGLGFATEAARALLGLAFDGLRAHRVTALVDERNPGSAAVAERLGMRLEARHVEGQWFKGEWSTTLVHALLRREWEGAGNRARSVVVSDSGIQSEE